MMMRMSIELHAKSQNHQALQETLSLNVFAVPLNHLLNLKVGKASVASVESYSI
jgi:hypothetical protein